MSLKIDDKIYKTVRLNNQIWMAENLNVELIDGSMIYNNDPSHSKRYGRLYTWDAAIRACPDGWHLPSDKEWEEMIKSLGGEKAAYHELLKEGDNSFNALFAGYMANDGIFMSINKAADFWTSTEADNYNAWFRYLLFNKEKVFRLIDEKDCGFSVRYVKD